MLKSLLSSGVLIAALALSACGGEGTTETSTNSQATPKGGAETTAPVKAEDAAAAESAALVLLGHHEGLWQSRWEWVNPEGEIVGEMVGTETFSPIIDAYSQSLDSVNTTFNQTSHALITYNKIEQKIIFFSLGAGGDYWVMKQDPFTGEMLSEPHKGADGRYQILRFKTLRQTKDAMDIQMEYSFDDGANWTVGFRQFMRRGTD